MNYILENDKLLLSISNQGAELCELTKKATGFNYLFNADPTFWKRHSPVLFPLVGSLKNQEYSYKGKTYSMGQHGFARDLEHILLSKTDNEIWFRLEESQETIDVYPFKFILECGYRLTDNKVEVLWKVTNPNNDTLHFSIGAHPAFNCPIHGEKTIEGYQLKFNSKDNLAYYRIDSKGLALTDKSHILPVDNETIIMSEHFFDDGVYIFEDKQTSEVMLATPDGTPYLSVSFDTPLFGIWAPEKKNAPFLCIEPWYGRCDNVNFMGNLEQRTYGNRLEAEESFYGQYQIVIY